MRMRVFLLALILLPFLYLLFLLSPQSLTSTEIRFVIPLNESSETTINRLYEEQFIRSKNLFLILAGMIKFPSIIEPGAYTVSPNMWLLTLIQTLLSEPYQKWIVLVPGLRKEQVGERLAKKFAWDSAMQDQFVREAKEGYLFPDTYLFDRTITPSDAIARMRSNFEEQFGADFQNELVRQNVRLDTAVKIASLIERESGSDQDKAMIAGIIWNRLLIDMRLQIDATSQYIKGTSGNWWPLIRPEDHRIDSPYNTYQISGLPPTAISNPSLASLKAVVYPAETECLFYLHDRAKQIHCAVTYEEHLENIDRYLR